MIRRQNHRMRSSLGTRRLKIGQMQKRAFVQRVNAMVYPFGVEREKQTPRSHSTLCFCPQNQTWQPHAAGLAAKCTAFGFAEVERTPLQPQHLGHSSRRWQGRPGKGYSSLWSESLSQSGAGAGQALASMRGRLHSGAGLPGPRPGCRPVMHWDHKWGVGRRGRALLSSFPLPACCPRWMP